MEASQKGLIVAQVARGYDVLPVLRGPGWTGHYRTPEQIRPKPRVFYRDPQTGVVFYRLRAKKR